MGAGKTGYSSCIVLYNTPSLRHVMLLSCHIIFHHTSNSCECMGVNGEALQLHIVYKKPYLYYKSRKNPYQYYKSRENPYQVVQVTRAVSERTMKLKVRIIKSLSP